MGRGALQTGSRLALEGAVFAARAAGCWNLFPLSDPKEPSFGAGLLGAPQKTSVLQGVQDGAQLSLPTTGKGWKRLPAVAGCILLP